MSDELDHSRTPTLELPGGLRIIGIDATAPGEDHVFLTHDVIEQRSRHLSTRGRVVLALHHPPISTGHAVADSMLLTNPDAVLDLMDQLPPVTTILCGHIHTPLVGQLACIPVVAAPGVASALRLDARQPPLTDPTAQPGFALHRFHDGGLTTSFHFVT